MSVKQKPATTSRKAPKSTRRPKLGPDVPIALAPPRYAITGDHDAMIAAIESLPARLAGNVAPAVEGIIRSARRATPVDEYEAALRRLAGADDFELRALRHDLQKRFALARVQS